MSEVAKTKRHSLREEAALRAASMSSSSQSNQYQHQPQHQPQPQHQQHKEITIPISQNQPAGSPTSQTSLSSNQIDYKSENRKEQISQQHIGFISSDPPTHMNPSVTAAEAREQWKQHGEHTSQMLEDRRQALLPPTNSFSSSYNDDKRSIHSQPTSTQESSYSSFPSIAEAPRFSVRIVSTEDRVDPAGAGYTVYILEVESLTSTTPIINAAVSSNSPPYISKKQHVARRYSDFDRLYKLLAHHYNIPFRSQFPSKSLAGRLGNWTPALKLAPKSRHDLITFRKIRLDIWLVELAELLGSMEIPEECLCHVIEFLTREKNIPPCQYYNVLRQTKHDSKRDVDDDSIEFENRGPEHNHKNALDDRMIHKVSSSFHHFHLNLPNPLSFTLGSEVRKSISILEEMTQQPPPPSSISPNIPSPLNSISTPPSQFLLHTNDQSIPLDLLHQAWGLCFLTVVKAGFIVSGRVGTGLLLARTSDGGWSPPCAIGTVGLGYGMLLGGDITSYLIILNTKTAVKAFASNSVTLGAEVGIAVGPMGRGGTGNINAGLGEKTLVSAYSYAHSKGLFMGISLEGSVVKVRGDVNAKFYGRKVSVDEILFGTLGERPRAALGLYEALEEAMRQRIEGWRPSSTIRGFRNKHHDYMYKDS